MNLEDFNTPGDAAPAESDDLQQRGSGGSAANDELVCSIDNSSDLVTVNSTLSFPGATWTIPLPAPISSGGID